MVAATMKALNAYLGILVLAGVALALPRDSRIYSAKPQQTVSSQQDSNLAYDGPSRAPVGDPVNAADSATSSSSSYIDISQDAKPEACIPPAFARPQPRGFPIKQLPEGTKPNFIIILTDDQGWDDIGMHNPLYVRTPNIDRFISKGTLFDNFYVTPQCAQTRAALLTGRMPPRVGTMLVHGGYDFINSGEATAAEVLNSAGYSSIHYGKWHNGRTLGYEPWNVGYNDSWMPPMAGEDALVAHNGTYVQTKEYLDEALMGQVLGYLKQQAASKEPFYMYYAPHAIHTSRTEGPFKGRAFRLYPERYRAKYNDAQYMFVPKATIDAWAMLEYLDDVLGRLFSYLDSSPLGQNTYVMLMSDNGPQLLPDERKFQKVRIPSRMQGAKSLANEAGIRNFLAVTGPGVQAGITDSTLLHVIDILPTMADLAGIPEGAASHKPWEGISFKHLLVTDNNVGAKNVGASGKRGQNLANARQYNRFVFALSPHCWDADAVPELGADREVVRPQPLFNYDTGGVRNSAYGKLLPGLKLVNPGFEACMAVRHREYKWLGATGKVYRFSGESHIELPCSEVTGPQGKVLAQIMSSAARKWWDSIINETSSFTKPVYYLGLNNWRVTNMLADGAHDRTRGNVTLLPNGASGFKAVGDRMCFKAQILAGGEYDVSIFYTSKQWAVFKLSVGPYQSILDGTAASLLSTLPGMNTMKGAHMGTLALSPSSSNDKTEACLELVDSHSRGNAVFSNLANIRFTRRAKAGETLHDSPDSESLTGDDSDIRTPVTVAAVQSTHNNNGNSHSRTAGNTNARRNTNTPAVHNASGVAKQTRHATPSARKETFKIFKRSNSAQNIGQGVGVSPASVRDVPVPALVPPPGLQTHGAHVAQPAPMLTWEDLGQYKWMLAEGSSATGQQAPADVYAYIAGLRQKYHWPEGQGVMESMFSPYDSEDIDMCEACKPLL